jgi:quercetin dioxygenase-like cupin family protein
LKPYEKDSPQLESRRVSFGWGMLVGASVMAVAGWGLGWPPGGVVVAAPAPAGSTSKVVLENERVRVKDVTFPPGVLDTDMHTHQFAHVGVILTAGTLAFTEPGKPAETVRFDVGSVGFREANATHRVTNPGTTPMRVIEVELK